ncbi:MAG: hypothetical protein NDJ89_03580 [Oligoflexia bacterium]|nr:hypothetical protein [Oligoflexia bacterium]
MKQTGREASNSSCAPESLLAAAPGQGQASVLYPDPVIASRDPAISPGSLKLDLYASAVTLEHLGGRGVLEGSYVEVRNGLSCGEWFGAFDSKNRFQYAHSDPRFQETLSYYTGDRFRARLDELRYLAPVEPVRIVAHCDLRNNAYFQFAPDSAGRLYPRVCLSDSSLTKGAYYSDDAAVTIHELQHATTTDLYTGGKRSEQLNQFYYDEAGALNEAVSDFVALVALAPAVPENFDPRQFSRWALDKFTPGFRGTRGANRCPEYDSRFGSRCGGFPGLSSEANTVSYVYPDGLGWPYADNFTGADKVRQAFNLYPAKEEIHNTGLLVTGALFDLYETLKLSHGERLAEGLVMKAVLEAIRHLPRPTAANRSPVTFRGFAATLLEWGPAVGLSREDLDAAERIFTERGLVGGRMLEAGWAQRGEGTPESPGVRIEDLPQILKSWLGTPDAIPQGIETGRNNKLDPGEVVALWFDLRNVSEVTAGGILLKVTSLDPDAVSFLGYEANPGFVAPEETQIFYSKINGTAATAALTSGLYPIATSNSYFKTVPEFRSRPVTPVWIKVSPTAVRGQVVTLRVEAMPSNGSAAIVEFPITIN